VIVYSQLCSLHPRRFPKSKVISLLSSLGFGCMTAPMATPTLLGWCTGWFTVFGSKFRFHASDSKQLVPKSIMGQMEKFTKIKFMDCFGTERKHFGPEVVESRNIAKLVGLFVLGGSVEERCTSRLC